MTTCKYVVVSVAFGMNLVTLPALSQTYPGKPVRVVVGFAAGGNVDIPARIVSAKLSEMWATPVVVDNRPGAGGNIAAEFVAKAAPDGYTLLMCNAASHGINPSIYGKIPFDPIKDFAPISKIGSNGNVLLVHPSSQLTTVNGRSLSVSPTLESQR